MQARILEYLRSNSSVIYDSVLLGIILVLGYAVWRLARRFNAVVGHKTRNSSDLLTEFMRRLTTLEDRIERNEPRIQTLEKIGSIAVQKVGFLRFNPFNDTGGDQSFALALLDKSNSGIIISSLYTRGGVRMYAKEVEGGTAKQTLSEEEKQVLQTAIKNNS